MTDTPPKPNRRRWRWQLAVVAMLMFVVSVSGWLWPSPPDAEKFYAKLEPHPTLCKVVRIGFVLAGEEDEFVTGISLAALNRQLEEFRVYMLRVEAARAPQ